MACISLRNSLENIAHLGMSPAIAVGARRLAVSIYLFTHYLRTFRH